MSDDIELISDFKALKMNVIRVDEDDIKTVFDRITEIGTLDYEEELDPKDSREPFRFMQSFILREDCDAEVLWFDADKKVLGAIRVSVVVDDDEEREFNSRLGIVKDTSAEGIRNDSHSSALSPYMHMCFKRALGLRSCRNP